MAEEPGRRSPAPQPLRLVQAFINTCDREGRQEHLASPQALRDWLVGQGLLAEDVEVDGEDVRRAVALREGLRALARANNGRPVDSDGIVVLDGVGRDLGLTVRFDSGGRLRISAASPVAAALAQILDAVKTGMDDGRWIRLKACQRGVCEWVFYDASRNRSGRWCTMDICGNRVKGLRAYHRRRQRLGRRGPRGQEENSSRDDCPAAP